MVEQSITERAVQSFPSEEVLLAEDRRDLLLQHGPCQDTVVANMGNPW